MSLLSRRPREKDTRAVVFDARPHNHVEAVDEMLDRLRDPVLEPFRPYPPGSRHCIPTTETESEVMPPVSRYQAIEHQTRTDTRPPSATEANPLDEIALLVRSLTYGEMMDLAAALWKVKPEGKDLDGETLPGTLHRWSNER